MTQVPGALLPAGSTYGALIYQNKNNATVRQFDEVRPGDVVVLRGTRFSGHRGSLHQKYTVEAGRGGEAVAGVIYEYDSNKRKVRVVLPEEGVAGGS